MIFGAFSKMVARLPAEAIFRAVDLHYKTIQDDLSHGRLSLIMEDDVFSILCFGQFMKTAVGGVTFDCLRGLPIDHLEFYRETIVRLVQANELPGSVMEEFDRAFAAF